MFSILALVSFVGFAFQVSSLTLRHHPILVRDLPPEIPTQCNSTCAIITALEACTSSACACTQENAVAIEDCADCAVGIEPSLMTEAQAVLDEFAANCSAAALPLTTTLTVVPSSPAATPTVTARLHLK